MPIYEYRCNSCRRKVSLFVRGFNPSTPATCTFCGGDDMKRLISAVIYHRSEADRIAEMKNEDFNNPSFYNDSRNVGLWTKKRFQELGATDMLPELDEIVEKGRSLELLKEAEDSIK